MTKKVTSQSTQKVNKVDSKARPCTPFKSKQLKSIVAAKKSADSIDTEKSIITQPKISVSLMKPAAISKTKDHHQVQPKRALSSYICFSTQYQRRLKEANPELTIVECSKRAGETWAVLNEKER